MAAGGDLGASVVPQLIGIITDGAIASDFISGIAQGLAITSEQFGMKLGFFVASLFPLAGVFLFLVINRRRVMNKNYTCVIGKNMIK